MIYRLCVLAALLLALACVAQSQSTGYKGPDYARRGGVYSVLNNVLLHDVDSVEYAGTADVSAYGNVYKASKFVVESRVMVKGYGAGACLSQYKTCEVLKTAEFELYVGLDETGELHDLMLKKIYDYWRANTPGKGKKLDVDEHLNYRDGEYLMFQALRSESNRDPRAKRLVWIDGKFIKFNFKRFTEKDAYNSAGFSLFNEDEALENFVGTIVSLRSGAVIIQPKQMKGSFREEFFRQYERGAFRRVV